MKQLVPKFILDKNSKSLTSGSFQAFTMFIDLSGFTALSSTLMKHGNEGAEMLSLILNSVFEPIVSVVYDRGGFIPYFAGDAFTAIFQTKNTNISAEELLATAVLMQDLFKIDGLKNTPFGSFQIDAKVGLSYGRVEWGIVGESVQSFYFKGAAIDNCAKSEHHAEKTEIVLDKHFLGQLEHTPQITKVSDNFFRLEAFNESIPFRAAEEIEALFSIKDLRSFLPQAVINAGDKGEFREVVSVFISFKGVDLEEDFNEFTSIIINQFHRFAGYFKEIDFGDKGGVIVGFFGAPLSFENNKERALEFVLDLQLALESLVDEADLEYKIGISSGLAYTGFVGGKPCCQYAAVGNTVNLAARLMVSADWGEVLTDEDIAKEKYFQFIDRSSIHFKGIEGKVSIFQLSGKLDRSAPFYEREFAGREVELNEMVHFSEPIFNQETPGIIYLYGEAGIGKSRLCFELRKKMREEASLNWFICQADQILKKPFNPFLYFLKNYFKQSSQNSPRENRSQFETVFNKLIGRCSIIGDKGQEVAKELERTQTILAALVGIGDDQSLWEQLDAKGRYQNTIASISNLIVAESLLAPTVIELEDAHWFDNSSKAFLQDFIRIFQKHPILLVVTSRYWDDGGKPLLFEPSILEREQIPVLSFDLNILSTLTVNKLAEKWLAGKVSKELLAMFQRATNGNPFYLEQMIEYFLETDILIKENDTWKIKDGEIKVSGSLNTILMARIDRLSSLVKDTVKAAAVIGREFEVPILTEVMKSQHAFREKDMGVLLREQIRSAERNQIWKAISELRYMFKHSLLREAVYDMQLKTSLRELHRLIGEAIERLFPEKKEARYADLAFHFEQAGIQEKTTKYLEKAAEYNRRNYHNERAINLYDKLLKILQKEKNPLNEIRILLKKGAILELIGEWDKCETHYTKALKVANNLEHKEYIGRANNDLGNLLTLKGNYEKARLCLETSAAFFEDINDKIGLYQVYGNLGNVFFRQGEYDQAKGYYIQSIEISEKVGRSIQNSRVVANLGLTYMNQGRYEEAIQCQLPQLKLSEEAKNKQGIATMSINLGIVLFEKGDYIEAMRYYKQGIKEAESLGDKLLMSIAIGCIGSVYERQGEYQTAMEHFVEDLELSEMLGDKQGIAIALGLIGDLFVLKGEFDKGCDYLERNLSLCREINYLKGIAKSLSTLGDAYLYKKEYLKAESYYIEAIEIAKYIDNKRTLSYSLLQLATLYYEMKECEKTEEILKEGRAITKSLDNRELYFNMKVLHHRAGFACGGGQDHLLALKKLLNNVTSDRERAAVLYSLNQIGEKGYSQEALLIYKEIYKKTPKYLVYKRMLELELNT